MVFLADSNIDAIERQQMSAYDKTCVIYPDHLKDLERAITEIGAGKKVLDVGCSDGQVMEIIAKKRNDVFGVDLSKNAVEIAKKRGLKVKVGNLLEIPFEGSSFDVVFCSHVIEHIFDTNKALKEFHRVLRKGGKLIIMTENLNSLKERMLFLFGRTPTVMADPSHVKFFNPESIKKELSNASFKVEKIKGTQIGFPIKGRCFFTHTWDFLFPTWLKEKMIVVSVKK